MWVFPGVLAKGKFSLDWVERVNQGKKIEWPLKRQIFTVEPSWQSGACKYEEKCIYKSLPRLSQHTVTESSDFV